MRNKIRGTKFKAKQEKEIGRARILMPFVRRLTSSIPSGKLGIAVSGGADSTAMAILLSECLADNLDKLCIFHVDHSMRSGSSDDAAWTESLAQKLGIKYFQIKLVPPDRESFKTHGPEGWAREQRYSALAEMASQNNIDCLCIGHTSTDQTETVLMRILLGTSLQGLSGIRSIREMNISGMRITLWRPLLSFAKDELRHLLRSIGQDWREDPTNREDKHFRNKVRKLLIPIIENIAPGCSRRICNMADDIRISHDYISNNLSEISGSFPENRLLYASPLPECLLNELLKQWIIKESLSERFDRNLISRLRNLLIKKNCGRKVICRDKVIYRTESGLQLVRKDQPPNSDESSFSITDNQVVRLGNVCIQLCESEKSDAKGVWLDPSPFETSLQFRYRSNADRIEISPGVNKKLSKWMIDQKIPVFERDRIPLLACGSRVLWIPGLRLTSAVSESFRDGCKFIAFWRIS